MKEHHMNRSWGWDKLREKLQEEEKNLDILLGKDIGVGSNDRLALSAKRVGIYTALDLMDKLERGEIE